MSYKVVIVMTTYNLEKYIGEALDSVVNQVTSFPYKILIGDDHSTDSTIDIINQYIQKYPDLIELRTSETNRGSLVNSNRLFDNLQCDYFTFLDGDDMWIGENRLQQQADFLDAHPDYMICAGNTYYLSNNDQLSPMLGLDMTDRSYSMDDMLKGQMPFFHTSSMLVRNTIFSKGLPKCFYEAEDTFENCALRGEDFRRYLHLEEGPVYVMPEFLSIYRIHEDGMWQGSSSVRRNLETAIGANFYKKYWKEKMVEDPRYCYFIEYASSTYKSLLKQMISDMDIFPEYKLGEKDNYLFTSLLNDICENSDR